MKHLRSSYRLPDCFHLYNNLIQEKSGHTAITNFSLKLIVYYYYHYYQILVNFSISP